mgnify:CR=1 FL=1
MALFDEVYGLKYKSAIEQMQLQTAALKQQQGKGFESITDLEAWAKDHDLDKVLFSNMSHQFMCVSHKGEIMLPTVFENYYGDILFYSERVGKHVDVIKWHPGGFEYYNKAYIAAEQSDGVHRPLYYRDYTVPTGYYSEERDAFNVAKPFPVFAAETGRDTSHIYTYIEHVAGECAWHLLAWLRAKLLYPTVKTQIVPIIVSRTQGSGKGQPLTSKVLTPTGFKALGDLKDGDLVVSPVDGMSYPISIHNRGKRHVNKITMSNGAVTYCDDFHIWQARTVGEQSKHKDFHEMTIESIKSRPLKKHYDTKCGSYDAKQIFVPVTCPVAGDKAFPGAYAIGLFIGDGCYSNNSIFIDEPDVLERCEESLAELGYALSGNRGGDPNVYTVVMNGASVKFTDFLKSIGVEGNSYEKHLPTGFLQFTIANRQELFEGLIDSDGCMTGSNNIDWSTSSEQLYDEMYDLASSLGLVVRYGKPKDTPKYQSGTGRPSYRYFMQYKDGLCLSDKHLSKLSKTQHKAFVAFESIEDAGDMDCCCIYVNSPDHLYITDDWIVTHNTTFAEVICKGLFGRDNVIVSDQYDSSARFNADYADALIVCQEEKEETDKRNPAGALKSRATATTIRKELKGIDPIYQESYTDFIMTTNKDVPIKFDGREDQRRFMIMEADETFTRKTSKLADDVFTKLYGYDANFNKKGVPFVEDKDLIAQFKHELFTRKDIADVELRKFPKTAAYRRCFSLPRTSEVTEIESIIRALVPFIKATLEKEKVITEIEDNRLGDIIQHLGAFQYMPAYKGQIAYVALCRPLVFYEMQTMKPLAHSTVERGILDCAEWLRNEYNIGILPDMEAVPGGFRGVGGRYKAAPAAKFCLATDTILSRSSINIAPKETVHIVNSNKRIGERLRVDKNFKINPNGCFETVNEMKPGVTSLKDKTKFVQYMDTFLLESDTPSAVQKAQEELRASEYKDRYGESADIKAEELYKERLSLSLSESQKLFDEGTVARIVYSGAKSYHLLIRVADSPSTIEEYKWLHAWLCQNISDKLIFDESTADPARLTRSPLALERVTSAYGLLVYGEQKLIAENWDHIYNVNWRKFYEQWQNRPLDKLEQIHGKPLYPTRQEYRDAAYAISDGTFWSDSKYDGDRQRLFFPAYRLLRILGYTNSAVFDDLLPKYIDNYKKRNEKGYWLSRKNASIIKQIDEEIDSFEAKLEEADD